MSLYQLQKCLFDVNRDQALQGAFRSAPEPILARYALTDEERGALKSADIGLLYVLGANGQLLMHFAAALGIPWSEYLAAMRAGVARYGPVRAGLYAMTTRVDEQVAGI